MGPNHQAMMDDINCSSSHRTRSGCGLGWAVLGIYRQGWEVLDGSVLSNMDCYPTWMGDTSSRWVCVVGKDV